MKRKPPRSFDNIDGDQDLPANRDDYYFGNDPGWEPPPDGDWRDPIGAPQPERRGAPIKGRGLASWLRPNFLNPKRF